MRNETALTHARHDPETCLAPGLFRTFVRNQPRPALDITYTHGDRSVQFVGWQQLGGDDLRVLQFLQARAAPFDRRGSFADAPRSELSKRLAQALDCHGDAVTQRKATIHTTFREVARETGIPWGGRKAVKATLRCLKRLAAITAFYQAGALEGCDDSKLLAFVVNKETGKVDVALSPRLTAAALGQAEQYVRIDMDEVRALKTDAARILHQRLCAWINAGTTRHATLATLTGYLYPDPAPSLSASARKKRERRVLAALAEIAEMGWGMRDAGAGTVAITRPPASGRKQDHGREKTGPRAGENRTTPIADTAAPRGV